MERPVRKQSSEVKALAIRARQLHKLGGAWTWTAVAEELSITDPHGKPSPGLAHQIAHEYMPGIDVCKRIGVHHLRCPACGQTIKMKKPGWVKTGAKFLEKKEREQ